MEIDEKSKKPCFKTFIIRVSIHGATIIIVVVVVVVIFVVSSTPAPSIESCPPMFILLSILISPRSPAPFRQPLTGPEVVVVVVSYFFRS